MIACYISYSVLLLTTIPLEHLPALKTIEESAFFRKTLQIRKYPWKKILFRMLLCIFFIFIISKIKNLAAAVDFFGAFFFTILSFIAPIIIYEANKTQTQPRSKALLSLNISVVILGAIFGGSSAFVSFMRMFREHE
jgi:hypothetical protein